MADGPEKTHHATQLSGATPLEPEYLEAFVHSALPGILAWVVNPDRIIVDITHTAAEFLGAKDAADIIGTRFWDHTARLTLGDLKEEAYGRVTRVLETGISETHLTWADHANGYSEFIITMLRLEHPVTKRRWVFQSAHDITHLGAGMVWLRDPAIQGLMAILTDSDYKCVLGTEAAAEFCGFESVQDLIGISVKETPYYPLQEREKRRFEDSRTYKIPQFDMEWLTDTRSGFTSPFAITRVGLQDGHSLVLFHPIDPRKATFMVDPVEALKSQLPKGDNLTERDLDVLLDCYRHLSPEASAARFNKLHGTHKNADKISTHRGRIHKKLQLPGDARHMLEKLSGTPLDNLMRGLAWIVDSEDSDEDE